MTVVGCTSAGSMFGAAASVFTYFGDTLPKPTSPAEFVEKTLDLGSLVLTGTYLGAVAGCSLGLTAPLAVITIPVLCIS